MDPGLTLAGVRGFGVGAAAEARGLGGEELGTEPLGLRRVNRGPFREEIAQGRLLGVRKPPGRVRSCGAECGPCWRRKVFRGQEPV